MDGRDLPQARFDDQKVAERARFLPARIGGNGRGQRGGQNLQGLYGRKNHAAGNEVVVQIRGHGHRHGNVYRFDGLGKVFHS